jgi:peroxiredoxin
MPAFRISRPAIASLVTLSLGLCLASGVAGADDSLPPPREKPPAGDAKPADPVKPADPATPADPKAAPPAKPEPVKAPDFTLKDLDGKERKLSEFLGKVVVLEWTNYSCPFVKKHYGPGAMQALQKTYTEKGVVWLSICSSAEGKQGFQKTEDWKKAVAEAKASPTALLPDADGTVGHLYGARTTPDMRIVDAKGFLAYSGAIDDDPSMKSDPAKAKVNYVAQALDAMLAGKEPPTAETKAYG